MKWGVIVVSMKDGECVLILVKDRLLGRVLVGDVKYLEIGEIVSSDNILVVKN